MLTSSIQTLNLTNYRNHQQFTLKLEPSEPIIVLYGPNGAGKTNILEALSLLSPGRGFRNAKLDQLANQAQMQNGWTAYYELQIGPEPLIIGQNLINPDQPKRTLKINQKITPNNQLAAHINVIWLIPQMEYNLINKASARRKLIDRYSYNFNLQHAKQLTEYENLLRERNAVLLQNPENQHWLTVLETKLAQLNIQITLARQQSCSYLQEHLLTSVQYFPTSTVELNCIIAQHLQEHNIVATTEFCQKTLAEQRQQDKWQKQTNFGCHRSDLILKYQNKALKHCSTGEQKSTLIALFLAQAYALNTHYQRKAILLLDDVAAHLDHKNRLALFNEIHKLATQTWLSGTDQASFSTLKAHYLAI